MTLRRVLLLADETADWMVAGLRQLERIALSIDEFAVENNETAPVLVCVLWRPDLDKSQRWAPDNPRLTHVAFTNTVDDQPYDLVLSTRVFLYRKAVRDLFSEGRAAARPDSFQEGPDNWDTPKQVLSSDNEVWQNYRRVADSLPPARDGAWEYINDGEQIDAIEAKFLRRGGKPQDGFVSRYLNRPVSRAVTRLLLRFPTTPNAWTWLIFPIPVVAALILARGSYPSFVWGLALVQIFSILDGCDGEIARAKFMESEWGRDLDDLFDVLSNILLVLGLGFGLRQTHPRFGWFYLAEGIAAGAVIGINEWYLMKRKPPAPETMTDSLGDTVYPRHRELVQRSGLLRFGEKFASLLIQLTKRDVAVLFFVVLAAIGAPSLILHLLLIVTAASLVLALKARLL